MSGLHYMALAGEEACQLFAARSLLSSAPGAERLTAATFNLCVKKLTNDRLGLSAEPPERADAFEALLLAGPAPPDEASDNPFHPLRGLSTIVEPAAKPSNNVEKLKKKCIRTRSTSALYSCSK